MIRRSARVRKVWGFPDPRFICRGSATGLTHEAKEHESNTTQGGYQGEHPLIEIRGSGVYVTEVKLRSNFSLRLCRPGAKAERQPSGLFAEGESEAEAQ